MDIGVFVPLSSLNATPELVAAVGTETDERGFESVWVAEHVVLFDRYASRYPYASDGRFPATGDTGLLEPFVALAYLAAVSRRIRLGTGICLVPQRNPVYTAKQVADVDVLSGGRVEFGVGIGWLAEEFRALGVPFADRARRTVEHLEVMRTLWCDDLSEHHGDLYDLPACRMYPKPVQKPHPPIHFGGESDAALGRVARMGQGWYGFNLTPDAVPERLGRLRELCAEQGRDPAEITVSVCPYLHPLDRAAADAYEEAGVDRLIALVLAADTDGLRRRLDDLTWLLER